MNKSLLLVGVMFLYMTPTFAQESPKGITTLLPSQCFPTSAVAKQMKDENQQLTFFGKTEKSIAMLYRNSKVGDWYIIMTSTEHPETSCFLADGLTSETNIPVGKEFVPERQALDN